MGELHGGQQWQPGMVLNSHTPGGLVLEKFHSELTQQEMGILETQEKAVPGD